LHISNLIAALIKMRVEHGDLQFLDDGGYQPFILMPEHYDNVPEEGAVILDYQKDIVVDPEEPGVFILLVRIGGNWQISGLVTHAWLDNKELGVKNKLQCEQDNGPGSWLTIKLP
jgi:hypothetical protein